MADYEDSDYAVCPKRGRGRGFETKADVYEGKQWRETEGMVETRHCLVWAYSTFYEGSYRVSRLELVKDGRQYTRRFDRELTARGLVTKAKQFAADMYA